MSKSIKILTILMVLLLVALTSVTAQGAGEAKKVEPKVLRVHMEATPKILMPSITAGREEEYVFELIHGTLVEIDEDGKNVPSIAESFEISRDKLTWTFKLKKGVKFHDGEELTAKDVAFSIEVYTHPVLGQWWQSNYVSIKGAQEFFKGTADKISGVNVIDDYTIAITTSEPNAALPAVFVQTKIYPKHIWENVPKTERDFASLTTTPRGLIGAGPFKAVEIVTDQYIKFVAHDQYFKGRAKLDEIYHIYAPADTGLAMLETGEVDLVYEVAYPEVDRVKRISGVKVETAPNAQFVWWIRFNLLEQNPSPIKKYLLDSRFRTAIGMVLDRDGFAQSVMRGYAKVTDTHAYSIPWTVPEDLPPLKYDPAGAKMILQEIGWNFDKDVARILIYPSNAARDQLAPILQAALTEIGVKCVIDSKDLAAARVDMYETFDYDIAVGGWLQPNDPSLWAVNVASAEAGGGRGNEGYANKRVDELFALGRQAFDFAEQQKIYQELVRLFRDDLAKVPVVFPEIVVAYTDRLQNFVLAPQRGLGARFVEAYKWDLK